MSDNPRLAVTSREGGAAAASPATTATERPLPGVSPRVMRAALAIGACVLGSAVALGSVARPSVRPAEPPPPAESIRTQVKHNGIALSLAESDSVITVTPVIRVADDGTILVADTREGQVRRYDQRGTLLSSFGSKGEGPKQFEHLSAAVTTTRGESIVFEMNGTVAPFTADGQPLERYSSKVSPLYAAALLDDTTVVLVGKAEADSGGHLVHIFDLQARRVTASFATPPAHGSEFDSAYEFTGFADVAVRGDRIAVLHALGDKIHFFDRNGSLKDSVLIPYTHYRPLTKPMPVEQGPEAIQAWTRSFSTASHLFWAADGTLLIQYFDLPSGSPAWRLLGMTPEGERRFDELNTPKLLATFPTGSQYLFEREDAETPADLIRVSLR